MRVLILLSILIALAVADIEIKRKGNLKFKEPTNLIIY